MDRIITGNSFIGTASPNHPLEMGSTAHVKAYIQENKSLEGLPDMNDRKGWASLSMQDRDMKLLEKIEELTLYVIQLKDENEAVMSENKDLKEDLLAMGERLKTLEDMFLAVSTSFPKEKLVKLDDSIKAIQ
ncbi:MAG: hypothetical protein V3V92_02230 [Candidatus Hydrothermarchaeales archaeon]